MDVVAGDHPEGELARHAEAALRRLGYSRVDPEGNGTGAPPPPAFWVQESGVPRRRFPVFLDAAPATRTVAPAGGRAAAGPRGGRAIFVVPSETLAEQVWSTARRRPNGGLDTEVSVLVLDAHKNAAPPHFHAGVVAPRELLWLATGVVVGLFRRAASSEGTAQVDFEEMIQLIEGRFQIDVKRSLGVASEEDALFMLYQLALRDSYAPGDPSGNLHQLVLRPTGPAARLPWFAG